MKTTTHVCKHGIFTVFSDDEFVGKSLENYGDYSEDEVEVFKKCLGPDDVAIEVGSNIGALTVPMARLCKQVYAFEPQPSNYDLLVRNLDANEIGNVLVFNIAVGSQQGDINVPSLSDLKHHNYGAVELEPYRGPVELGANELAIYVTTLDLVIPSDQKIKFIKIDVEGMEIDVLKGAEVIIARDRPIIYCENDREEKSDALIGWLLDHGYRCYLHQPPLFYKENFKKNERNVWNRYIVSINMLCVPAESNYIISKLDEVHDPRVDDGMHKREYERKRFLAEKNGDLQARISQAHFANLDCRHQEARDIIAENLRREPGHVASMTLQGLFDLQDGKFESGWKEYEYRFIHHGEAGRKFGFRIDDPIPHWDGQPTDETILIHSEQGFGDSIMFVRFMNRVKELAPNAILAVQPQLYELFEESSIIYSSSLYRLGRTLPPYSMRCSLPSLPATLGLKHEYQVRRRPYLFVDEAMVDIWRKRDVPRIGICLKGGVASERSYSRDMPESAVQALAEEVGGFFPLDNTGQWESFMDSGAAMASMDMILTVDTSVAHLAGAMGLKTFLMLSTDPDWRWQLHRSDSPWYPSMKIFRQSKFMDWSGVVENIRQEIVKSQTAIAAE